MKYFKLTCFFALLVLSSLNVYSQRIFLLTSDLFANAKNIRKKQTAHNIQSANFENGDLTVNFIASIDRRNKHKPFHITIPVDSILGHCKDGKCDDYTFDSLQAGRYKALAIYRNYDSVNAFGFDVMCTQEILTPGFANIGSGPDAFGTIEILDGKEYPFVKVRITQVLEGKHLVFICRFSTPVKLGKRDVNYLRINIEHSRQINRLNYLKLPFTIIADIILLPFEFIISGMEK